jgi:hypothetical protein
MHRPVCDTVDKHPCPLWDSNPQFQQAISRISGINANNLSTVILVMQPVGAGFKWLVVATEDNN